MTEVAAGEVPGGWFRTTHGEAKVTVSGEGVSFLPFSGFLDRDRHRMILIGVGVVLAVVGAVLMSREFVTVARVCAALAGVALLAAFLGVALESAMSINARLALGNKIGRGPIRRAVTLQPADLTAVSEVSSRGGVPRFVIRAAEDEVVVAATPWQAKSLRRLRDAVAALADTRH